MSAKPLPERSELLLSRYEEARRLIEGMEPVVTHREAIAAHLDRYIRNPAAEGQFLDEFREHAAALSRSRVACNARVAVLSAHFTQDEREAIIRARQSARDWSYIKVILEVIFASMGYPASFASVMRPYRRTDDAAALMLDAVKRIYREIDARLSDAPAPIPAPEERVSVDFTKSVVVIDGVRHKVDDDIAAFVDALVKARGNDRGGWTSFSSFKDKYPALSGVISTRLFNEVKKELGGGLIESSTRFGYRLIP